MDAVDLSGPMIRLARRKRPRSSVCYLESGILDVEGCYDFVVSAARLHHVPDLPATLAHIKSLANPGGRAALVDVVSPRPATLRWRLYGGQVRTLAHNLVRRGATEAWKIFRLSTASGSIIRPATATSAGTSSSGSTHRVPTASFTRVGRAHAMLWDHQA